MPKIDNRRFRCFPFHLSSAIALAVLFNGCGAAEEDDGVAKGKAAGTVSIGGSAFEAGGVHFSSTTEKSDVYGAEVKAGGEFEVASPIPVGSYKVSLSPPPTGPSIGPDGNPQPAAAADLQHNIPTKYLTAETSDKTVEIKEGDNTLTIELAE